MKISISKKNKIPILFMKEKVHTFFIDITFSRKKIEHEEAYGNIFMHSLIKRNKDFPMEEEWRKYLDSFYGARISSYYEVVLDTIQYHVVLSGIHPKYVGKDFFKELIDALFLCIEKPEFQKEFLEKEKESVIATILKSKKDPQSNVSYQSLKIMDDEKQFLSYAPWDDLEIIKNIEVSSLQAFYANWIKDTQKTIFVYGNVTKNEVLPLLEEKIGAYNTKDISILTFYPITPQNKGKEFVFPTNYEASYVTCNYKIFDYTYQDIASLYMLRLFLNDTSTRLLGKHLREKLHLTYHAYAKTVLRHGLFGIFVTTNEEKIEEAKKGILEVMATLTTRKEFPKEFEKLKELIRESEEVKLDDHLGLAYRFIDDHLKTRILNEEVLETFYSLTIKEFKSFLERISLDSICIFKGGAKNGND